MHGIVCLTIDIISRCDIINRIYLQYDITNIFFSRIRGHLKKGGFYLKSYIFISMNDMTAINM